MTWRTIAAWASLALVGAAAGAVGCTSILDDGKYYVDGGAFDPFDDAGEPLVPDGGCRSDTKSCAGNTPEVCVEGSWVKMPACGGSTPFCIGSACAECMPGTAQCDGLKRETCSLTGKWTVAQDCPYLCVGAGVCSGACTPGAKQCQGNGIQTCDPNGAWMDTAVCSFGCTQGDCSGSCVPGTQQCSGTDSQTCDTTGAMRTTATCPYICKDQGTCAGHCVPKALGCSGSTAQQCNDSAEWDTIATCAQPTPDCQNGGCTCMKTTCPAGCVDTQSDSTNCGACGHDCGGAACVAGTCATTVVASSQSKPWGIATDGTSVYWSNSGDGTIRKAAVTGGAVTTLASGQNGPLSLTLSSGFVYWASFDGDASGGGTIMRCAVGGCGGAPSVVTAGVTSPWGVAADATNVYLSAGSSIYKSVLPDGGAGALASESRTAYPVVLFGGNVYWTDSIGAILKCAVGGCSSPTTLAQSLIPAPSYGIAVDGTSVYFTNFGFGSTVGSVGKVPIGGGNIVPLAPLQNAPVGIAVDADFAYFANSGDGTIKKVPIGGGSLVTLATGQGQPNGLAIDGSFVYWTNLSSGQIVRVAK